MTNNILEIFNSQKNFFDDNNTKPVQFRVEQLKKLRDLLKQNTNQLDEAIYKDFRKSSFENYETELGLIYKEISLALRNLNKWTRPKKVRTNLANMPASSYLFPEPYGNTLIIGAWNYPYQLTLAPLVASIAAGNTAIVKPSELSSNCSAALAKIINTNFRSEYLYVQEGSVNETTELLNLKFDKIFFTGSTRVGKIVMQAAAKNLTPVALELGGKSPVIVLEDADLKMAAKRITWGKFLNAGQTCIAPDYLLIHKNIKSRLLDLIVQEIKNNYGEDPSTSTAYVNVINQDHYNRLVKLIDIPKIYYGGVTNEKTNFISPTLMDNVSWSDPIMEDEIFGPLLPVIEFSDISEIIKQIKAKPKPLALYLFTSNTKHKNKFISEISFGGGAINDTLMHISNPNLPFGGVGFSGIGAYHSEVGFKEFSHIKSVLMKPTWFEPFIKYPPYTNFKRKLLKLFLE